MSKQLGRWFAASIVAAFGASGAKADGISSIAAVPGGFGLDNAGQVLTGTSSGLALWQDGVMTPVVDPQTGQQVPSFAYGSAISPGGTIAYSQGYSGYGATERAYVLKSGQVSNAGTASDGLLAGGDSYSIAHAVNDAGAVAGESHAYGRWNRAFTSSPGPNGAYQPVAMGANGGATSNAYGINNQGVVVGWSDVATQWRNHAFVGSPSSDIGTLGGLNSEALAINGKTQVVGWSTVATGYIPPPHPDGYHDPGATHAFLYQNGKMSDLGALAGYQNSVATAINASGLIVGYASNAAVYTGNNYLEDPARAVLFEGGKVIDLNSLLPANSGWLLQDATAINDAGQVLGTGTYNGTSEAFLLNLETVPEPTSLALFGMLAVAGIAGKVRGRRGR